MNRFRAAGLRPVLLIPWLVLTLTDGGIHEHAPPPGKLLCRPLQAGAAVPASLSRPGDDLPSPVSYCSACMWQLTAHFVLTAAPALPPPAVPSASLPTHAVRGPAMALPRPEARAPPSP
jgi:hypothetical protein